MSIQEFINNTLKNNFKNYNSEAAQAAYKSNLINEIDNHIFPILFEIIEEWVYYGGRAEIRGFVIDSKESLIKLKSNNDYKSNHCYINLKLIILDRCNQFDIKPRNKNSLNENFLLIKDDNEEGFEFSIYNSNLSFLLKEIICANLS